MLGTTSEDAAESEFTDDGGMSNREVQASTGVETFKLAAWDRNALIMSLMGRDSASSCAIDDRNWKWGEYADGVPRNAVGIPGYSSSTRFGEHSVRGVSIFCPRRIARGSGAGVGPSGEPGKDIAIVVVEVDTLIAGRGRDGESTAALD
jgi:hypothetical protein